MPRGESGAIRHGLRKLPHQQRFKSAAPVPGSSPLPVDGSYVVRSVAAVFGDYLASIFTTAARSKVNDPRSTFSGSAKVCRTLARLSANA